MSRFHPEDYAEGLLGPFPEITEGGKVLIGLQMVADAIAEGLAGIRTAIAPTECGPRANLTEVMLDAADIIGDKIANAVTYHADARS